MVGKISTSNCYSPPFYWYVLLANEMYTKKISVHHQCTAKCISRVWNPSNAYLSNYKYISVYIILSSLIDFYASQRACSWKEVRASTKDGLAAGWIVANFFQVHFMGKWIEATTMATGTLPKPNRVNRTPHGFCIFSTKYLAGSIFVLGFSGLKKCFS